MSTPLEDMEQTLRYGLDDVGWDALLTPDDPSWSEEGRNFPQVTEWWWKYYQTMAQARQDVITQQVCDPLQDLIRAGLGRITSSQLWDVALEDLTCSHLPRWMGSPHYNKTWIRNWVIGVWASTHDLPGKEEFLRHRPRVSRNS